MKIKNIINNNDGYIFVIVSILIFVGFLSLLEFGFVNELHGISTIDSLVFDENYQTMEKWEREEIIFITHGAQQRSDIKEEWRFTHIPYLNFDIINLDVLGWLSAGDWYYVFPDGYNIKVSDYDKLVNGEMSPEDINWSSALTKVFLLDFEIFKYLGVIGLVIRLIIGLIVGLIVYLMLPFTGG